MIPYPLDDKNTFSLLLDKHGKEISTRLVELKANMVYAI